MQLYNFPNFAELVGQLRGQMARIRPWYKIIDTNMAQTNEAGWRFWVEESLRLCTQAEKSRQWRQLAASPLRQTPLIVDLLSIAEQNDPVLVGQGIYATLLWGVDRKSVV